MKLIPVSTIKKLVVKYNINTNNYGIDYLRYAASIELEHKALIGNDPDKALKIALAHIEESDGGPGSQILGPSDTRAQLSCRTEVRGRRSSVLRTRELSSLPNYYFELQKMEERLTNQWRGKAKPKLTN